jgi:hypothetical protein
LEDKKAELQRTISGLKQQQLSELREFNLDNTLDLEVKQEKVIFTNDVFILPPDMVIDYHLNENETQHSKSDKDRTRLILY